MFFYLFWVFYKLYYLYVFVLHQAYANIHAYNVPMFHSCQIEKSLLQNLKFNDATYISCYLSSLSHNSIPIWHVQLISIYSLFQIASIEHKNRRCRLQCAARPVRCSSCQSVVINVWPFLHLRYSWDTADELKLYIFPSCHISYFQLIPHK